MLKTTNGKKPSDDKNKGGRPSEADSLIRSMNDRIPDTKTNKILQDRVQELITDYHLTLDDISDRTEGIVNKGYLSMISRGMHLLNPPKCRPRQIHAYAIGLVYANVRIEREHSREETDAAHELNDALLKMLPKLKRYMKAKATR